MMRSVTVSRAGQRPRGDFWPFGLRDPLPTLPIPLGPDDQDARLDLRSILDRVYDESGYAYFVYDHEPDPPLGTVSFRPRGWIGRLTVKLAWKPHPC
jgi:hypothetical protein